MPATPTALKQFDDHFDSNTASGGNEAVSDLDPLFAQAVQRILDLKSRGQHLDIKVSDVPYNALVQVAEQLRDFGFSNNIADVMVDALETQATQLGADFTRKEKPTPMEVSITVADKPPVIDQSKTHFMVAFDGKKKYGSEYSTAQMHLTNQGTKTSTTNIPALESMFLGGNEQYLIFHFEKLSPESLQGMEQGGAKVEAPQLSDAGVAAVGLLEAAGPRAKAAELEPVRRAIEQGTITPQQTALITSTANLNRVTEQIVRTPTPVQNAPQIIKPVQAVVTQNLQAVTNARQLPAPAVMNAVIASVQKAEVVTTAQKPIVAAPQIVKADNSNKLATPAVAVAVAAPQAPKIEIAAEAPKAAQPIAAKSQPVAPAPVQPVAAQPAAIEVKVSAPARQVVQPQQQQFQAASPIARAPVQAAPQVAETRTPVAAAKPVEVARAIVQPQQQSAPVQVQPQQAYVAPVFVQPVVQQYAVPQQQIVPPVISQPVEVKQEKPAEKPKIVEQVVLQEIDEETPTEIIIAAAKPAAPIHKKPIATIEESFLDSPFPDAPARPVLSGGGISAPIIPSMPVRSEIAVPTESAKVEERVVEAKQQEAIADKVVEAKIISEINALGVPINTANINVSAPGASKQAILQQVQQQIQQKQNQNILNDDAGDAESDRRKERDKFIEAQRKEAEEEKAKKEKKERDAMNAARVVPMQMATIEIGTAKTPAVAQSVAEADYQKFFAKTEAKMFQGSEVPNVRSAFSGACSGNCGACAGCSIAGNSSRGRAPSFG